MDSGQNASAAAQAVHRASRLGVYLILFVFSISLIAALALPKSFALSLFGDSLEFSLVAAATVLSLRNAWQSRAHVRVFWLLLFAGSAMWLTSMADWSFNELFLHRAFPEAPLSDILLFLMLVPFSAAAAFQPSKVRDSRLNDFGLLDFSILILYSLYLFAFWVYPYRMLPGAEAVYNSHFNLAAAVGNQLFALVAGIALFRARRSWRPVFGFFFFGALSFALSADFGNAAMDRGLYYTGSLYDVPLCAALAGFVALCLTGRPLMNEEKPDSPSDTLTAQAPPRFSFLPSHLAMLVTISTPGIGLWLLTTHDSPPALYFFRLDITLFTIFLLTLLLSIKQDFLSANLMGSLRHLSATYSSIERFQDHLVQSEKLAALGALVARVSNEIKDAMVLIRDQVSLITSRSEAESRSLSLAGKIGLYALRTDVLVENMQRFAQETPLQLAPVEVKPLLESALHLSRISKLPNLSVSLQETSPCPPVLADSSQLLHVFLQLLSNAMDALGEVGGGELDISIRPCDSQVCIQFADTGPGIKHPEHVFEPFFTTKPVGKGTGLGLSTCYGIIRQHDGDISFSNRLDGGAVFTIFLPAAAPVPESPDSASVVVEGAR